MARTVRKMGVSDFKTHCLRLVDELQAEGGEILLTRRGKAVARVLPAETRPGPLRGSWAGRIEVHGDLLAADFSHLWRKR